MLTLTLGGYDLGYVVESGGTPAARGVRNYIVGEAIGPTKQYRPQDKPQPTKTEDEITAIYAGRRYDD